MHRDTHLTHFHILYPSAHTKMCKLIKLAELWTSVPTMAILAGNSGKIGGKTDIYEFLLETAEVILIRRLNILLLRLNLESPKFWSWLKHFEYSEHTRILQNVY